MDLKFVYQKKKVSADANASDVDVNQSFIFYLLKLHGL